MAPVAKALMPGRGYYGIFFSAEVRELVRMPQHVFEFRLRLTGLNR